MLIRGSPFFSFINLIYSSSRGSVHILVVMVVIFHPSFHPFFKFFQDLLSFYKGDLVFILKPRRGNPSMSLFCIIHGFSDLFRQFHHSCLSIVRGAFFSNLTIYSFSKMSINTLAKSSGDESG